MVKIKSPGAFPIDFNKRENITFLTVLPPSPLDLQMTEEFPRKSEIFRRNFFTNREAIFVLSKIKSGLVFCSNIG